ncbi:hypothetical protein Pfo_004607 [Paulownia fortunei]|nr:hypothetical protein Pfo_004607 [Paulownia fortunei]
MKMNFVNTILISAISNSEAYRRLRVPQGSRKLAVNSALSPPTRIAHLLCFAWRIFSLRLLYEVNTKTGGPNGSIRNEELAGVVAVEVTSGPTINFGPGKKGRAHPERSGFDRPWTMDHGPLRFDNHIIYHDANYTTVKKIFCLVLENLIIELIMLNWIF